MAGHRAVRIAVALADRTQATLADRGVPPCLMPAYGDLIEALWPVASGLAFHEKHAKRCRKLCKQAKRRRKTAVRGAADVRAAADVLEAAAGSYAAADMARRPDVAHSVAYDPADWRITMQPVPGSRRAA